MTETEKLISKLKLLREQKKLSLRDVEELTGIPHSNIAAYESGRREPTYENICKILKAYHKRLEIREIRSH